MSVKLKECPEGGSGVHAWLFYAACRCVEAEMPDDEARKLISSMMTRRPNPATEVEDALRSAGRGDATPAQKWPTRNFKLIQSVFANPEPPAIKPVAISADEAIDYLFPGNPLLCIGESSSLFATKRREAWRGCVARKSLIVPSPMTERLGRTQRGHLSAHSLENTGPRAYLITEFDWGEKKNQLKLIAHLAHYAPLACVVDSGGKSIHGWFQCEGRSEEKLLSFMQYAVSIGADFRTWLRSQFVRLPGGMRDNGNRQEILFLDRKLGKR